jgi:Domain of unknown function DUF302
MLASPSTAIDLPLKMLVWEDAAKKMWISYNSPEYLQKRHGFPQDLLPNICTSQIGIRRSPTNVHYFFRQRSAPLGD